MSHKRPAHAHPGDHPHGHTPAGNEPHVHAYRLLSRDDCRQIDRLATEQFGMPSILLMENAGRSITEFCTPLIMASETRPSILIAAGTGNNGGDGLVAARHLANLGARVAVLLSGPEERLTGDALTNLTIVKRMGIPIKTFHAEKPKAALAALPASFSRPTFIIDAVLGTGFEGSLRPDVAALLKLCNTLGDAGSAIVSVDVPSGLNADTGEVAEGCIEADLTVSLVSFKAGMLTESGREVCGEIVSGDIGIPFELIERFGEVVEFECDHEHGPDEMDEIGDAAFEEAGDEPEAEEESERPNG